MKVRKYHAPFGKKVFPRSIDLGDGEKWVIVVETASGSRSVSDKFGTYDSPETAAHTSDVFANQNHYPLFEEYELVSTFFP
jgi:hypothetical protein